MQNCRTQIYFGAQRIGGTRQIHRQITRQEQHWPKQDQQDQTLFQFEEETISIQRGFHELWGADVPKALERCRIHILRGSQPTFDTLTQYLEVLQTREALDEWNGWPGRQWHLMMVGQSH